VQSRVQSLVATRLPGYRVDSVVPLGEGLDHVAYEVNGELIVRVGREPDLASRAARVRHEARLLAAVADISPLPVPAPTFTVEEEGCLAYVKLPGVPLLHLPGPRRAPHGPAIAARLGEFLAALHAAPVSLTAGLVETDATSPAEWRGEAAEAYAAVADHVPAAHRAPIRAFLDAPPPREGYALAFSHNDLGIEHVLVDPTLWTVTGVLDWSDAAIVDPAYDFGLIHRDLGPAALDAALGGYRTGDAALRERAVFYARCRVFEDLAYGLETGRQEYADKSLAALVWLFPPPT
jgi:aminoglycoside phosphotransferase (APT) family kinase protein